MPQIVSPSVPSGPATTTERYDLGMVAVFDGAIGPPPDQSETFPESPELRRLCRASSRCAHPTISASSSLSHLLASVQGPRLNVQKS
jgi:hypothetical protein